MQGAQGVMRRIGKALRATNEELTHEPLPERWVDLIHYLLNGSPNARPRHESLRSKHSLPVE